MKPSEYLDAVRVAVGAPSDYALQGPLQLSKQQIARYRKNLDFFSDAVCMRGAEILKSHPGLVMLDMHRERAKTPQEQGLWQEIYKGFLLLFPHGKGARLA
jgi:hypothetical protein